MVTTMDSTPFQSCLGIGGLLCGKLAGPFAKVGSAHHQTESDDKPQIVGTLTEENQGGEDSQGDLEVVDNSEHPFIHKPSPLVPEEETDSRRDDAEVDKNKSLRSRDLDP